MVNLDFYKNKTVLVTGHTGFKGTWLSKILINAGAKVIGYSLPAPTNPNLFELSRNKEKMVSIIGDIRNYDLLLETFIKYKPECVFHLAAQPIVRDSYKNPKYTYETNVIGTVNILECIRLTNTVKSFLNVTTDKVYYNNDIPNHPFKESEPLDGYDPYSNSKSCSELVTSSYKRSFFSDSRCAISTARAGNVIGGGDFAADRIIPDCIRSYEAKENIIVRNPYSTRPYQHVLEPLFVYLEIVEKQYMNRKYENNYNIGPDICDCINTGDLVSMFCNEYDNKISWINKYDGGPHEASFLMLDNSKIKNEFGYTPTWHIKKCIEKIKQFNDVYFNNKSRIDEEMTMEIKEFIGDKK